MRARLAAAALLFASPPALAAEASLAVDSLTVDGQEVRALSCTLREPDLVALLTVVGALAQQKAALDACAPRGAAFRVRWTWGAKTAAKVEAARAPKAAEACVARALERTRGPAGACGAIVLAGDPAAAAKAAEDLRLAGPPRPKDAPGGKR